MNTFSNISSLSSKAGSATEDSASTTYDEYGIKVVDKYDWLNRFNSIRGTSRKIPTKG